MSIKLILTTCLLAAAVFVANAQLPVEINNLPPQHQQLVLVTAVAWNSQTGLLQLYHRTGNTWTPTGKQVEVVLGKNGLGWGRGLHAANLPGPEKVEGDGKTPAGIFKFGEAFGYSTTSPAEFKIPYRQSTERDYWVDAATSSAYNSWVTIAEDKENNPKKYWSSFERMKRADHLYELGIVIKHNMGPVLADKGSAIFMHIWRRAGSPTIGCTAMSKQDLTAVLAWLDPEKKPLFIQAPTEEIKKLIQSSY